MFNINEGTVPKDQHNSVIAGKRHLRDLSQKKIPGAGWSNAARPYPSKVFADEHTFVLPILRDIDMLFSRKFLTLYYASDQR